MKNHHLSAGGKMTAEDYAKTLATYRVDPAGADDKALSRHLPLLECLDRIERSSTALFDMSTMSYRFLTGRFRFLLGLDPDEAKSQGMDYFFRRMNTNDLSTFFQTSIRSFEFLNSLSAVERKDYKTCQDFRIRRADDTWIRLIQQTVVLELDRHGAICLVLIVTDESPLKDSDVPARRYMEHVPSGRRVLFASEESDAESPLTPRELEVLGLVSRGYQSREIAD
jgi:hypothetical protein